jgi:hypothetical protein
LSVTIASPAIKYPSGISTVLPLKASGYKSVKSVKPAI